MMTFIEALATYGRDSMALSSVLGIPEHAAYNLMAREIGETVEEKPIRHRSSYTSTANRKLRQRLREIRREAQRGAL